MVNYEKGPYDKELSDWLLEVGFIKANNIIMDSYSIDIRYKDSWNPKLLSFTLEYGNQYGYIRECDNDKPSNKDDLVSIFNSDIRGHLTKEIVSELYKALTGKNLVKK